MKKDIMKNFRITDEDKEMFQFLTENGVNLYDWLHDNLVKKIKQITGELSDIDLISSNGCVGYNKIKKELKVYDYRIITDQIGMYFDLIEPGKIRVDEKNHTLHIRI